MEDQKMENLLNLALDATSEEREKSLNLNVGYDPERMMWDIIVKYSGDITWLEEEGITVVPLLNEYAVLTVAQNQLPALSARPEIEYIEKPKRLFFAVNQGKAASCILSAQGEPLQLSGRGILMGIVDSGERVILLSGWERSRENKGTLPNK